MRTRYSVMSEKGIRSENQDNFCVEGVYRNQNEMNDSFSGTSFRRRQSFFIFDGMGGEEDGGQVSLLAALHLAKSKKRNTMQDLYTQVLDINQIVYDYAHARKNSVGTTIAGIVIDRKKISAINVGDTRIYQLHNGELIQISMDHTLYQFKLNCGMITGDEVNMKEERNILTQYLGISPQEFEISPFLVKEILYSKGDLFLICSDGIFSAVTDRQIKEILLMSKTTDECCTALIQKAVNNNGKDNMTAVVVRI